ncbi:MAG: 2-oxo acid dehydrogenase subunit E2 [candidate division Zixibacteria bacterium]|nr:2-oxo acid dehydrogenase subunit E2 [candidate division Zixibacteria bacterium]
MPTPIVVPQMGESVVEGTVGRWMKSEGDPIAKDETVVEIMTDKINVELPAAEAGVLGKILVPEGTVVAVGAEIGIILASGESLPAGISAPRAAIAHAGGDGGGVAVAPKAPAATLAVGADEDKRSSPVVRRLLREYNLSLQDIPASGAGGRVTKEDVLKYLRERTSAVPAKGMPAPKTAPISPALPPKTAPVFTPAVISTGEPVERIPLAGVRKVIAEHMVKSKQVSPHVMSMDEVDLTELVRVREAKKDQWKALAGANVTYMPFFVKAVVAALKEFPNVNASVEGDQIVYRKYYHIGVAVARDQGLIVPVVKFADQKPIVQIARELADLSDRARRDALTLPEITGSTFTLTNAGMFGALASTPIINQPELAIIGMHQIQKRPVVRNDQIVIRDMMYLTISFDHRIIDGHVAVQFLRRVCEWLENPYDALLTLA